MRQQQLDRDVFSALAFDFRNVVDNGSLSLTFRARPES